MNVRNTEFRLVRRINLSVAHAVDKVNQHYSSNAKGASHLPVLAMHSVMTILARDVKRYENCTVLPRKRRSAAESRNALIGDIHIVDAENRLFEGYEVKHNVPITSSLIQASFEKLRTTPVKNSTFSPPTTTTLTRNLNLTFSESPENTVAS